MNRQTRRRYLAGVAGVTATGVAGCLGDGTGSGAPTTTDTDSRTGTATPTATASTTRRLVVEAVDLTGLADGQLTVYPPALRWWLRDAATGETVRGHDGTYLYTPEPVLPQLDSVRLETPDGDVDGTYDVTADGGTRYQLIVGADPVDPPADATVTAVEELPADRRELAEAAIDPEEYVTVYHETELGEWVREDFFGGYFEHDGEIYRGTEVQQTDAEFFSKTVWCILSLSPAADADDPAALRLPEIDPSVRDVVDELLGERTRNEDRTALVIDDPPDAVVSFAEETDYLLTQPEVLAVEVEP